MGDVMDQILFSKQNKRYREIEDIAQTVLTLYSGSLMTRDGVFDIIRNYGRKNEQPIQILRYPFNDDGLWAFTFLKGGTIFICINTGLSLCKQFFATAHEFYHIYCFCEDQDLNTIRNGSILKGETVDSVTSDQEEIEANAFAGLLLMPSKAIRDQIALLGINEKRISLDEVVMLMDVFAIPYKACVLRLYECGIVSVGKARELYETEWNEILAKIKLTGRAKRWQLDGSGTEQFGTLLEDFSYNCEDENLVNTRERCDREFISLLKERFHLDVEET